MVRSLSFLVVFVAVTLWGLGRAEARKWLVCEADLPTDDTSPQMDEERPVAAPAPLPVRDTCSPGTYDDASCWPQTPIPERGVSFFFGSSESYTQAGRSHLSTGSADAFHFTGFLVPPLPSGHSRRLERPPRAA